MEKFVLTVFPGACTEAICSLAALSKQTLVPKGQLVVAEGDTGEEAEALVLMVNGVASVLKKAYANI